MIKVTALTTGQNIPSSRFRVRQYIGPLKSFGVDVHECCPIYDETKHLEAMFSKVRRRYLPPLALAQLILKGIARIPGLIETHKSQITWIERNILPGFEYPIYMSKAPRVLDVDDAIWTSSKLAEYSAKLAARNVDVVLAGNNYIAEWYSRYCNNVHVVPTAIDCQRYMPKQSNNQQEKNNFTIGWTGTSANFKYLKQIEEPLKKFLISRDDAVIIIVADRPPANLDFGNRIEFVKWTPEIEASILQRFDVGIMPLSDDIWTRGKCSFKMLQYMATGLPVIVSPVGMNNDVMTKAECGLTAINHNDWYAALETYYHNFELRMSHGNAGLKIIYKEYSISKVVDTLSSVFKSLC